MSANVKLMHQINHLIEAIRLADTASSIRIPDYSNINHMNTETLIKLRTRLIRHLMRIDPSYPVKNLNLGNLQEIRSSSYVSDKPLADMPLKKDLE